MTQEEIWVRFAAAALTHWGPKTAAGIADELLAEYRTRYPAETPYRGPAPPSHSSKE